MRCINSLPDLHPPLQSSNSAQEGLHLSEFFNPLKIPVSRHLQSRVPYRLEHERNDVLDVKTLVSSDAVFLACMSFLKKAAVNTGLMMILPREIWDLLEYYRELLETHDSLPFFNGILHPCH